MKTKIYNLIILDESGSMGVIKPQTISGCNETINTIRSAQEQFADTQEHYVSIYAFQDNDKLPSRYLIKNEPIATVSHINNEQYRPWGCTPLYDAIGATLADLKAVTKGQEMSIASVTIITDGMENASKQYTREQVAKMIEALKELGWSFNFIGANIDAHSTASSLSINNAMAFKSDAEGTRQMFEQERCSRMRYYTRTSACLSDENQDNTPAGKRSFIERMKDAAANYFRDGDDKD